MDSLTKIVGSKLADPLISMIPQVFTFIQIRVSWVGAARTRAPAATNYDVHAPRREMLGSSDPKCNG